MKIKLFLLILFCAFPAFGEVFIMQTGEERTSAKLNKTSAHTEASLPADVDDEMLPGRPIKELIRYVICGLEVTDISVKNVKPQGVLDYEEQNEVTLPDKYTTVDHGLRERCGVYYGSGAAGKGLAVQAALKDLGEVSALQIRQSDPIRSNRGDFNIKGKKPSAVKSFSEKGIYKKVLSSKNKIIKLYNYADLPLADEIQNLMNSREGNSLPIRISVYEDSAARGEKALAVISFTLTEKYIVELKDVTEVSADVYDIKPDYSYIYK